MINRILNINEHYGRPAAGQDYTPKLNQALLSYEEKNPTEYVFSADKYEFRDPQALRDYDKLLQGSNEFELSKEAVFKNSIVSVKNRDFFQLDGQGALFSYSGLVQPFRFTNCHNIRIRNLTLDWERPLFSQGRVVSSDSVAFVVEIFSEFPVTGAEPISAILDYEPNQEYPIQGQIDLFQAVSFTESIGSQLVKVHLKKPRLIPVNTHLILRHILNYRPAFSFYKCSNISFENVTIHSAPGMGIVGHRCENFSFQGLTVCKKADSTRVFSTNTDATHFISCKGDILFKDCYFQGMGDDAVNVHGFYINTVKKLNAFQIEGRIEVEIISEELELPVQGETVEFVNRETLKKLGSGSIKEVQLLEDNRSMRITFENAVPEEFNEGDLLANTSRVARLRIEGCTVRNNRARGLLIQTRDVVINDNIFDHCTGTGIHINCATNWMESISTERVTVTNNRFISCGKAAGTYSHASAVAVTTESAETAIGVHSHILLANNEIIGNNQAGIVLSVSTDVTIRDNSFESCEVANVVKYSRQVTISGNKVSAGMIDVRIEE